MAQTQTWNGSEWVWEGSPDPTPNFGAVWGTGNSTMGSGTPPPAWGGIADMAGAIQNNPQNYFVQGSSNVGSGGLPSAVPPPNSQGAPPPATTPPPASKPPATTPPPDPMRFFRTDLTPAYNGIQYANQAGQQRVASFLPGSQQTQTATAFGVAPQAITNYGGVNMNTGLINNLINQYGEAQARAMIDAEVAAARRNGGGNYTVGGNVNDASLEGYLQRDPSLRALAGASMPAGQPAYFSASNYVAPPPQNTTPPPPVLPPPTQTPPPATQQQSSGGSSGASGNNDLNQFFQMLMLILGLSGLGGQNRTQAATGPVSHNPLWYSNYY